MYPSVYPEHVLEIIVAAMLACFFVMMELNDTDPTAIALRNAASWLGLLRFEEGITLPHGISTAKQAATVAIESVTADEDWSADLEDPKSRRARYGYAAWLIFLAATADKGVAKDFAIASELFALAADAT